MGAAYRAFVLRHNNDTVSGDVEMANTSNLPQGEVLIKVKYSSLSYIDALILSGDKTLTKQSVFTPGVDAAGIVAESSNPLYKKGDEVIVSGFGLGETVPGGLGQYIRVPSDWVISLPIGLTLKDTMALGIDGLSAAIASMELLSTVQYSKGDCAAVSGATFGVGAIAASLLKMCGFKVTAIVSDRNSDNMLEKMGVSEIVTSNNFIDTSDSLLLADKYLVALDSEGGDILSTMIKSMKPSGSIAVCGMNSSAYFKSPIYPLIRRGINILGVDSLNCAAKLKSNAWYKLANEWFIKELPLITTEISLSEVEHYATRILKKEVMGTIVINHEL